jgi:AcrR family transcriptional regulator
MSSILRPVEDQARDLPAPLDLIWGVRGQWDRERRHRLSAERIVGAAVELADAAGLEAVTMSRVAERLGVTTMALYRHLRSKDELVALMVEAASAIPPATDDRAPAGWRSALEGWSWDLLAMVRRHPWALEVPLARMPFGPNRLAWLERGLQAFAETSLGEDEKAALVLLVNNHVFSEARLSAELGHSRQEADAAHDPPPDHGTLLSALADRGRFPALRRALDAGIFDPSGSDRDTDFAFGLERILDGIEHLVAQRADERE